MKQILVIGSGAREHVIGETLKRSQQDVKLFYFGNSKNPGLVKLCEKYEIGKLDDFENIKKFALENKIDFAVCGPEAPLAAGITDYLLEAGIRVVGPNKKLAQLESSKSFTRDLLDKNNIKGNPLYKNFFDNNGLKEYIGSFKGNYVIKADGLKGGKGVKVSGDHLFSDEEGYKYALECLRDEGKVVVEEKLIGQEFSLMSFCDGTTVIDMPAVQDHKRAYDKDKGPNTGGMGSYSDANHLLPFLTSKDIDEAHHISESVANAIKTELGEYYKGILYGGFIATKNGVSLIEYNARFGDPEAMNVLPLLETDFVLVCEAILDGNLDKINVNFRNKAMVCKYAVPRGYPDNPIRGTKISLDKIPAEAGLYFASVDEKEDGLYLGGSRAIAIVAEDDNIFEAEDKCEDAIKLIEGPVFHRSDIGTESMINEKVRMMEKLRS